MCMVTAFANKRRLAMRAGNQDGSAAHRLAHQNDPPASKTRAIIAEISGVAAVNRSCWLPTCRVPPVCAPAVALERGQHLLPPRAQRAYQISPPHALLL